MMIIGCDFHTRYQQIAMLDESCRAADREHRTPSAAAGTMTPVRSIEDLPGPSRLPLLGNAHQARTSRLHSVAEQWCERWVLLLALILKEKESQ